MNQRNEYLNSLMIQYQKIDHTQIKLSFVCLGGQYLRVKDICELITCHKKVNPFHFNDISNTVYYIVEGKIKE